MRPEQFLALGQGIGPGAGILPEKDLAAVLQNQGFLLPIAGDLHPFGGIGGKGLAPGKAQILNGGEKFGGYGRFLPLAPAEGFRVKIFQSGRQAGALRQQDAVFLPLRGLQKKGSARPLRAGFQHPAGEVWVTGLLAACQQGGTQDGEKLFHGTPPGRRQNFFPDFIVPWPEIPFQPKGAVWGSGC